MQEVRIVVRGVQLASKSNSRRLVYANGQARFVLSPEARAFCRAVDAQVPALPELLTGDLIGIARITYTSRRPDTDAELIWDCLQRRIYANDRQVREKHIYTLFAPEPLVEVVIRPLVEQEASSKDGGGGHSSDRFACEVCGTECADLSAAIAAGCLIRRSDVQDGGTVRMEMICPRCRP